MLGLSIAHVFMWPVGLSLAKQLAVNPAASVDAELAGSTNKLSKSLQEQPAVCFRNFPNVYTIEVMVRGGVVERASYVPVIFIQHISVI